MSWPLTPTAVKTANFTASNGDFVPVDASGGSVTITLPSAPPAQAQIGVKVVNIAGSYSVTVQRSGSDTFNTSTGPTSLVLSTVNQAILVQYQSGIWYVLAVDVEFGSNSALTTRNDQFALRDVVSIKDYACKVDGVTDDTAGLIAAVKAAAQNGYALYIPAGTCLTTAAIYDPVTGATLHSTNPGVPPPTHPTPIPWMGPGVIKRVVSGNNYVFSPAPNISTTNTFWVSPSGSDTLNDGLTPSQPFQTLQQAFSMISMYGAFLTGRWTIQVAQPASITIAAGSNGQNLPQATINVASTTGFPSSGTILIGGSAVTYTGTTSTTFTGCSGGSGMLSTGETVQGAYGNQPVLLAYTNRDFASFYPLQIYGPNVAPQLTAPSGLGVAFSGSGSSFAGGTTYYWVLTAYNANGETVASNVVSGAPAAGQNAVLSWTPVTPGTSSVNQGTGIQPATQAITGYRVYRSTSQLGVSTSPALVGSVTAQTTVAAGSNGQILPQATINVASTSGFPSSGTIGIGGSSITYTGTTSTSFTGCSGGSGTLSTGELVELASFTDTGSATSSGSAPAANTSGSRPSAIFDGTGAPAGSFGIQVAGSVNLWLYNLMFQNWQGTNANPSKGLSGNFNSGNLRLEDCCFQTSDFGCDALNCQVNGFGNCQFLNNTTNGWGYGLETKDAGWIDLNSTANGTPLVQGNSVGVYVSENSDAHPVAAYVDSNVIGIHVSRMTRFEADGLSLSRNAIAVQQLLGGMFEDHNSNWWDGTSWANTQRYDLRMGSIQSNDAAGYGASERFRAIDATQYTSPANTSNNLIWDSWTTSPTPWQIPPNYLNTNGHRLRIRICGACAGTNNTKSVSVKIGGAQVAVKTFIASFAQDFVWQLDLYPYGALTTIASASNGQILPQATINVASTTGFPSSGTIWVGGSAVTYTGTTSTTFTGCSGGSGTLSTGEAVTSANANTQTSVRLEEDSSQFPQLTIASQTLTLGGINASTFQSVQVFVQLTNASDSVTIKAIELSEV